MSNTTSDDRLTENEVILRRENEKAERVISDMMSDEYIIHFICECSDLDCTEKIDLTSKQFKKLHEDKQYFVVRPGHQIASIEDVIEENPVYFWVRKKLQTSS